MKEMWWRDTPLARAGQSGTVEFVCEDLGGDGREGDVVALHASRIDPVNREQSSSFARI